MNVPEAIIRYIRDGEVTTIECADLTVLEEQLTSIKMGKSVDAYQVYGLSGSYIQRTEWVGVPK
jgi:hypothetical protein